MQQVYRLLRVSMCFSIGNHRECQMDSHSRTGSHLTNSRAPHAVSSSANRSIRVRGGKRVAPDAAMVLRGDSTLRGHLLDEYLGVCDQSGAYKLPTLLLAPALPSAGRVTVGGVQLLSGPGFVCRSTRPNSPPMAFFRIRHRGSSIGPASDPDGLFSPAAGVEIGLDAIRTRGADVVAGALLEARRDDSANGRCGGLGDHRGCAESNGRLSLRVTSWRKGRASLRPRWSRSAFRRDSHRSCRPLVLPRGSGRLRVLRP